MGQTKILKTDNNYDTGLKATYSRSRRKVIPYSDCSSQYILQNIILNFFDSHKNLFVVVASLATHVICRVPITLHTTFIEFENFSPHKTLFLTGLVLIFFCRFPITLHATFIELATIKNRGRLRKRMERQRMEEEDAIKNRLERQKNRASQSMEVDI